MEFLDILCKLESNLIIEFLCEFFIADQADPICVHIEEFILEEKLSDNDSQDTLELHNWHTIHIDDFYYISYDVICKSNHGLRIKN